jgi:azurin
VRKSYVILFAILSAVLLLAIACGSDEADPSATATVAPPATVPAGDRAPEPTAAPTSIPATAAPAPTGGATGPAQLNIDVNGDALQFSPGSLSAAAGSEVVVTFNNSSGVNSHNWALVEAGTKDAVATDGLASGQGNNWLPVDDSRVIGATILLGPGESADATFTAPAAGTYQFVCTFPGHNFTMFGDFTVN